MHLMVRHQVGMELVDCVSAVEGLTPIIVQGFVRCCFRCSKVGGTIDSC